MQDEFGSENSSEGRRTKSEGLIRERDFILTFPSGPAVPLPSSVLL